MVPRIRNAYVTGHFSVALTFTDGRVGTVDLAPWIANRSGVFARLQDQEFFKLVSVDNESGTLVWPNGVDLDPDVLYALSCKKTDEMI